MINVSRETEIKLRTYLTLLSKWQKAINLVGPKTLCTAWERHILDSLQLSVFIPQNHILFDFGSGAGFPGLALSIARPDLSVILFEADSRKCSFMKAVSRETESKAAIINERIENIEIKNMEAPDIITARALASLKDLLSLSLPFAQLNPRLTLLFLKGENVKKELEEAMMCYEFNNVLIPSQTDDKAWVIKIDSLRLKPA